MASRNFNRKQCLEREIKDIYLQTQYNALIQAAGVLDLTNDVSLIKVAGGASNNGSKFTTEVLAAAANPTNTVLAAFTGTAPAIVATITPNDGTNNPTTAATAVLTTTNNITLTDNPNTGVLRNTKTFTTEVLAAAANPTSTVLAAFTGTASAIVCTITPNDGSNNPTAPALATVVLSANIYLTKAQLGSTHNGDTFTIQVNPAAANPTNTVLVTFSGTSSAITCTVTPNDGTNNAATPVNLTTAELVELVNSGAVVGKVITLTDSGSLRDDQTATGGDSTPLADSGEGDGVVGTFSGGVNTAVNITTAQLVELINTGLVSGRTITLTDASSLRVKQTASGGGAAPLADAGEGDHKVGTFSGGVNTAVSITTAELVELINSGSVSGKTVTVTDSGALRNDQTASGGGSALLVDAGEGDHVIATFAAGQDQSFSNSIKHGIDSIVESAPGVFRITFQDKYNAVKFVDAIVLSTSARDLSFQIKADDINGAIPYVDVISRVAASNTNPSNGDILKFVFELKNTDII